jgi:hypothetical protein
MERKIFGCYGLILDHMRAVCVSEQPVFGKVGLVEQDSTRGPIFSQYQALVVR